MVRQNMEEVNRLWKTFIFAICRNTIHIEQLNKRVKDNVASVKIKNYTRGSASPDGWKSMPRRCIAAPEARLFPYTAIDEFTRLRFLATYPEQSTSSSADFLKRLFKWYARKGNREKCAKTDNGFEFTNRFPTASEICHPV